MTTGLFCFVLLSRKLRNVLSLTCAGSGISRECCLTYAAEGARGVVVAGLDYGKAISSNQDFRALVITVDVCDRASVDDMNKWL
jgi:NAD(P)-dependent dehydrogenase (short-subunit alcohol dehydrogenase family)